MKSCNTTINLQTAIHYLRNGVILTVNHLELLTLVSFTQLTLVYTQISKSQYEIHIQY